ncbi:MAG: hypothetical protein R3F55_17810 [Alphaproteobacteria bacterium]
MPRCRSPGGTVALNGDTLRAGDGAAIVDVNPASRWQARPGAERRLFDLLDGAARPTARRATGLGDRPRLLAVQRPGR